MEIGRRPPQHQVGIGRRRRVPDRLGAGRTNQPRSESVGSTPSGGAGSPSFDRRAAKPPTSSSIPSSASARSNGVIGPPPDSTSARWMPVSWVCRRAQNASGEGAGRNVNADTSGSADESVSTSAACPARNHSTSSAPARPAPSSSG